MSHRSHSLVLVCLLPLLAASCRSSPGAADPGRPEAARPPAARVDGDARPIAELPAGVAAPQGQLTLHADYASARDQHVTVYLINRTGRTIDLPNQDGDPYLKLEARSGSTGPWERAQRHLYSDCGNSYMSRPSLPTDRFLVVLGWYPSDGEAAQVRYRLYGGLEAVSNAGPGRVHRDEVRLSRYDEMAVRSGDVRLVRAVLFDDVGLSEDARQRGRQAALARLSALPRADAVPVIDKLFDGPAQGELDRAETLRALREVAPDVLAGRVMRALSEGASRRRTELLSELRFLARIEDARLVAAMVAAARDPAAPDLEHILEIVAGYRTPEVEALLASVEPNGAYPEQARLHARYLREEWFGDKGIDGRFGPIGNYSDGHQAPVWLDVSLKNTTGKPLSFSYDVPTDILSLYVTIPEGRDKRFVPPRAGVRWFSTPVHDGGSAPKPPGTPAKNEVRLAPGEEHKLRVAVMHTFDLPRTPGGGFAQITVWMSVKLPGVHRTPALIGGGAGINPR